MAVNSTETYKKNGDVFIKTLGLITATGVKIDLLPNSKGKGGVWGALSIFENIEYKEALKSEKNYQHSIRRLKKLIGNKTIWKQKSVYSSLNL